LGDLKDVCTRLRHLWLEGQERNEKPLTGIYYKLLKLIEELGGEGDTQSVVYTPKGVLFLKTFPLVTFSNMTRALGLCSTREAQEKGDAVYNRFDKLKTLDQDIKEELYTFIKEKYSETQPGREGFNISTKACIERTRKDGGCLGLFSDLYRLEDHQILGKTTDQILEYNTSFVRMKAFELTEDMRNHTQECKGEYCTQVHLHPLVVPVLIKESGGRVRIPCYTSGIVNRLGAGIREKLFKEITTDNRSSFNYGGKRVHFWNAISKMTDQEIIHSSDLKSSTDHFSFDFARTVGLALLDGGKIDFEEYQAILLLTGPMRIVPHDTKLKRVPLLSEIRTNQQIHLYDRRWEHAQKGFIAKFAKSYRARHPGSTNLINKLDPNLYRPTLSALKRELEREISQSLTMRYEKEYLTKCGLHMATSISIAMLNLMNLFADTYANKVTHSRALTQITGDDALRMGKRENIEAYKNILRRMHAEFSDSKDATTLQSRALYTEILIENGKICDAPMPKLVVRPPPEKGDTPLWLSYLSVYIGIRENPMMKKLMRKLLLRDVGHIWDSVKSLPIRDLRIIEGGEDGDLSEPAKKILSIKDPWEAVQSWRIYTSWVRIKANWKTDSNNYMNMIPAYTKPKKLRYKTGPGWEPGTLWLKDVISRWEARERASRVLTDPKWFSCHRTMDIEFHDAMHRSQMVIQKRHLAVVQEGYLETPRTPIEFKKNCLEIDVYLENLF